MRHALIALSLLGATAAAALAQDPRAPRMPPEDSETGINAMILIGEPKGEPLAGAELDRVTHEVASLVRCPVCQGLSIADSPVDQAGDMRREVRELLAAGFARDQILEYFEKSYGEFIRLEPKAEGFNLVVWIAPLAAVVLGAVIIAWRVGHRAPRGASAAAAESLAEEAADDAELAPYLERVRREVYGVATREEAT